ncbi:DNA polymerase beta superfamily protein [Vulgatibacter sp.]|uniref:nucleotidyltransferase domain-containing protein n=1 Tax=Vulgatibacter sp. TaxID=1971226 RepID=UPI003563EE7B
MEPTLIYETVHGSRAYGVATATSDVDVRGVIVGPPAWYHGYRGGPEQIELSPDHVRYEIRKLFRLLAASNPTLIEVLWTAPADHLVCTAAGEKLLALRQLFLSRKVERSFAHYAMAQLRRIQTHRRWLLVPPQEEPRREAFGLPPNRGLAREQQGAAEALLAAGEELPTSLLELLDREKRWQAARREWEAHRSWLRSRNPQRAEAEARFGYDTKHAMHLVRLLRMAREILATGQVQVRRPDRDELLAIRAGSWSYEELVEQAESLFAAVEDAARTTTLPAAPDEVRLDQACQRIVEEVLAAAG